MSMMLVAIGKFRLLLLVSSSQLADFKNVMDLRECA